MSPQSTILLNLDYQIFKNYLSIAEKKGKTGYWEASERIISTLQGKQEGFITDNNALT